MLEITATPQLNDPALLRGANYIDGEWVVADSSAIMEVRNPSTGKLLGMVPAMGRAETRRAIEAAQTAFPKWRAMLAKERLSAEWQS